MFEGEFFTRLMDNWPELPEDVLKELEIFLRGRRPLVHNNRMEINAVMPKEALQKGALTIAAYKEHPTDPEPCAIHVSAGRICGAVSPALAWAKATADWQNVAGNNSYVDCVRVDDRVGTNPGDTIRVYLPRSSGSLDPSVWTDDIIAYQLDDDGFAVAPGYCDDKIGTVKWWSGAIGDIPNGWRLLTDVNGTSYTGQFPRGYIDLDPTLGTMGATGGSNSHTHDAHDASDINDHAADVTGASSGTTGTTALSTAAAGGTTGSSTTGITIDATVVATHDDHTHCLAIPTLANAAAGSNVWAFESNVDTTGVEDPDLEHDSHTHNITDAGHTHSVGSHTHAISPDPHSHSIGSHTHTTPALSHSGTLAHNSADHTPEWIVVAWIERYQ